MPTAPLGLLMSTPRQSRRAARHWIAVASAEHARLGRDHRPAGFMQVCHGRGSPLKRVSPGDYVAYYAPSERFGGRDRLQAFVSVGTVAPGSPYQANMGNGFMPWRRDVHYAEAREVAIAGLLDQLAFTRDSRHWGYKLRFGLFEVAAEDMHLIAGAMQAPLDFSSPH
ncbi:EVE domain-containing protein [uncultured Pseudacidovorax sp.]|uniref:EVE domain-containing protein n=1 Tax=uncultured Pseudacidovorax sp. TaxID=679313 RepID=UPI0025FE77C6|nr:EVE domain-containing protein [uncultured Pseudacidovorax sp.]